MHPAAAVMDSQTAAAGWAATAARDRRGGFPSALGVLPAARHERADPSAARTPRFIPSAMRRSHCTPGKRLSEYLLEQHPVRSARCCWLPPRAMADHPGRPRVRRHARRGLNSRETVRRRWAVLAVVSAAQFLVTLDLWVVNIALPALQHDFAPVTLSEVSSILDVYAIVLAALLLPAGRAADNVGRRKVLPGRARTFRHRVARVRGGPGSAGADRLPRAAGGRGRGAAAHLTGAGAVGVPGTSAGHRGRDMGRGRRGSRSAVAGCWAACWSSRAGAGYFSSICPLSSPPWRQARRSCRGVRRG